MTLYFADFQAQYVVPEDREIVLGDRPAYVAAVEELLRGPQDRFLSATLAKGTRLLGITVDGDLATVNFSREFRDNHPGGSAGEAMTIESLVYTLTELPGIARVQILVEEQVLETLGHFELIEPIARGGIKTYPVFVDMDRQAWLQRLTDEGQALWRLDPVEVARRDGRMAGFRLEDSFTLKEQGKEAVVGVSHENAQYVIRLAQPVRSGIGGIWTIVSVDKE